MAVNLSKGQKVSLTKGNPGSARLLLVLAGIPTSMMADLISTWTRRLSCSEQTGKSQVTLISFSMAT